MRVYSRCFDNQDKIPEKISLQCSMQVTIRVLYVSVCGHWASGILGVVTSRLPRDLSKSF